MPRRRAETMNIIPPQYMIMNSIPLLSSAAAPLGMAQIAGVSTSNIVLTIVVFTLLFFGRSVAEALPGVVANIRRILRGSRPVEVRKHVEMETPLHLVERRSHCGSDLRL